MKNVCLRGVFEGWAIIKVNKSIFCPGDGQSYGGVGKEQYLYGVKLKNRKV